MVDAGINHGDFAICTQQTALNVEVVMALLVDEGTSKTF